MCACDVRVRVSLCAHAETTVVTASRVRVHHCMRTRLPRALRSALTSIARLPNSHSAGDCLLRRPAQPGPRSAAPGRLHRCGRRQAGESTHYTSCRALIAIHIAIARRCLHLNICIHCPVISTLRRPMNQVRSASSAAEAIRSAAGVVSVLLYRQPRRLTRGEQHARPSRAGG